jgi:hypothetical protein
VQLAEELERSHISRTQFQKDLVNLEKEIYDKEQIYLEKMVALERELEGADAVAQEAIKVVRDECEKINQSFKVLKYCLQSGTSRSDEDLAFQLIIQKNWSSVAPSCSKSKSECRKRSSIPHKLLQIVTTDLQLRVFSRSQFRLRKLLSALHNIQS